MLIQEFALLLERPRLGIFLMKMILKLKIVLHPLRSKSQFGDGLALPTFSSNKPRTKACKWHGLQGQSNKKFLEKK